MHWFPWQPGVILPVDWALLLCSLASTKTDQNSNSLCLNRSQHHLHWLAGLLDASPWIGRVVLWERHLIWCVVVPLQIWWIENISSVTDSNFIMWNYTNVVMTWTLMFRKNNNSCRVAWKFWKQMVFEHSWAVIFYRNDDKTAAVKYLSPGSLSFRQQELQWCFARKFLIASSPRLAGPNIIS